METTLLFFVVCCSVLFICERFTPVVSISEILCQVAVFEEIVENVQSQLLTNRYFFRCQSNDCQFVLLWM